MEKQKCLESLIRLAEGISLIFGNNCETIVHEFKDGHMINHAIFNGHVSGRSSGSNVSIFSQSTMETEHLSVDDSVNYTNQLVHLNGGRIIKSSTFFFKDEDYTFALGINYDITVMSKMENILSSMLVSQGDLFETMSLTPLPENDDPLENLYVSALRTANKDPNSLKKQDRLTIVRILQENNYFHLQGSVPFLSEKLGVSKYTIYKYLKELENEG